MELTGEAISDATGGASCRQWREVKIQERSYAGDDGRVWNLENRYSARAIEYFDRENCEAERIRGIRWLDRSIGNWMEYRRSDAGSLRFQLMRYGDRYGTVTQQERDETGRRLRVKDPLGNAVLEYDYTGENLTAIRDNPQLLSGNESPAREVRYAYGTTVNANGGSYAILTEVTDVQGNVTTDAYDGPRLKSVTAPEKRVRHYTWSGDRIGQVTDAADKVTAYAYDRSKKEYRVRITPPETEAGKRIVEERYDEDGVLIGRDINGETIYRKTRLDNLKRNEVSADGAGRRTRTEKDEFGNVVKTIPPDNTQTQTQYSAAHGQIVEESDEAGIKTRYDYVASGKLSKKTEAVGTEDERITEYEIDGYGRVAKITRKGGTITLPDGQTHTLPDAITTTQYDDRGNRIQVTDPEGNVTGYEYDMTGAVTAMTDALVHSIYKYFV
jgi:YD repeat-containing protein